MKPNRVYEPLRSVARRLQLMILIFFLTGCFSSPYDDATESLSNTATYDEVKQIWIRNKSELVDNYDWRDDVKNKLTELKISPSQFEDLPSWFPVKKNINILIVPDLSRRLTQNIGQANDDRELILHIWQCFKAITQENYNQNDENTHDKITISVTPEREDIHRELAKFLLVDADKAGEPGSAVYVRNKEPEFTQSIHKLYQIAEAKPVGADYWKYISSLLNNHAENTLFERYRNIVIILTDGYLEAEPPGPLYTGSWQQLLNVRSTARTYGKPIKDVLKSQGLAIPPGSPTAMEGWEVLVVEVRERSAGSGDYDVLKQLWGDWFRGMGAKVDENRFFQMHQNAMENTKDKISDFLNVKSTIQPVTTGVIESTEEPSTRYDALLNDAEIAIKQNDFGRGKNLLTKAQQLQIDQNLPDTPTGQRLYSTYRKFADDAFTGLNNTKSVTLLAIPLRWYELAQLLKQTPDPILLARMQKARKIVHAEREHQQSIQKGNPDTAVIIAPTAQKKDPNEVSRGPMSKVTSTVVRDSFLKQIEGELGDCDFDRAAASLSRFNQQHPEWRDDALVFRYGRQIRSIEMESRKLKSWKTSPNRQAETKRSYEVLCKLRPACFSDDYFAYLLQNGLTKQQN